MKKTKKSLLFSGLALMMSALLLAGTTFAWFTDSVTNTGNVITSGNLSISAVAYDVDTTKKTYTISGVNNDQAFGFETEGTNLKGENVDPIISEELWEPGISDAKLLTVTNDGTLAADVQVKFDVTDGGLMNALWFDFIQVDGGTVYGDFTKRPMSDLTALGDAKTITLEAKQSVSFILVYGMNEEADNEYQGKTFSADVTIVAKQATVETDGFGNDQYDADAEWPVIPDVVVDYDNTADAATNGAALQEAINEVRDGGTVLVPAGEFSVGTISLGDKDVVLQGSEGTVLTSRQDEGFITVRGADGAKLTVRDMTFTGTANNDGSRGICFSGQMNSNITAVVENCTFEELNTGIYLGGVANATVTGCTFTNCTAGIGGTDDITGQLTVSNCTFNENDETIGWAGTGVLVITGCPTCESFNDYTGGAAQEVTVSDGEYTTTR